MFVDIGPYPQIGERHIAIEIDDSDVWSMNHTLALIILPMLKKLETMKHGSPFVEDEDVPMELRSSSAPPKENEWDTDDFYHDRWNWVLSEMIWAFEQILDEDNDSQFHTGVHDILWEPCEHGYEMKKGLKDTHVFHKEAWLSHNNRINNGTTLFGKYYRGLWD